MLEPLFPNTLGNREMGSGVSVWRGWVGEERGGSRGFDVEVEVERWR